MIRMLAALVCAVLAGCVPMTRYEDPITGEAGPTLDAALREIVQGYGSVIFEDAEQFELRRK